jgi:hypothetical protein
MKTKDAKGFSEEGFVEAARDPPVIVTDLHADPVQFTLYRIITKPVRILFQYFDDFLKVPRVVNPLKFLPLKRFHEAMASMGLKPGDLFWVGFF